MSARSPRDVHTPISAPTGLVEDKYLELVFDVLDVSFNYQGHFILEFVVQNPGVSNDTLAAIRLRTRHDARWNHGLQYRTGMTHYLGVDEKTSVEPASGFFYFPKGFCKNDKDHDLHLLVVTYEVDPDTAKSRRIGEGKMPIYPRSDTFVDIDADYGEPIYQITDKVRILRPSEEDKKQLHCGTVAYRATLRETHPLDQPEEPPPPPPKKPAPKPPPSKPKEPPPKEPPPRKTPRDQAPAAVTDSPLPPHEHNTGEWRLLAADGKEEVSIIVHGAKDLPAGPNRTYPRAFVTAKTKLEEDQKEKALAITHAFVRPAVAPSWEELLNLDGDIDRMANEVIILSVADASTKTTFGEYRLPIQQLVPFQHNHLDMIWPVGTEHNPQGVHLYATIVRKLSYLPPPHPDHHYRGLEAKLVNFRMAVKEPVGPLIATCTVISDVVSYKKFYAGSELGVDFSPVTFPSPLLSEMLIDNYRHSMPQISLPGRPMNQPRWNHSFLFCQPQEMATLFTHSAALVFEFFPYADATAVSWTKQRPLGHAVVVMDEKAFKRLDVREEGIRVEVPVTGALRTGAGTAPTALIHLRLHKDQVLPDLSDDATGAISPVLEEPPPPEPAMAPKQQPLRPRHRFAAPQFESGEPRDLSAEEIANLPPFKADPVRRRRGRDREKLLVKDGELPSESAMENAIAEHSYILPDEATPTPAPRNAPVLVAQPLPSRAVVVQPRAEPPERMVMMEGQMAELDRYRHAVQKMGHDIVALRERIRVVEGENSVLRRDLAAYNDTSKILLDSVELDGLPKSDLISRYVALKQKLTGTTAELATYKEKVQKLQNDLIKKNQKEEDYLRMSRAHTSQQELLQKLQNRTARVKKLEEACRQQEKVIERMERLLQNTKQGKAPKERRRATDPEEINSTLMEENRRLRRELEEWREQAAHKSKQDAGMDDAERLELYQLLDKAEGRIASLEKQMSDQARKWGKDKETLVNRLREYEFGLSSNRDFVPHLYGQDFHPDVPSSHVVLPVLAPVNSLPSNVQTPTRHSRFEDMAHNRRRLL